MLYVELREQIATSEMYIDTLGCDSLTTRQMFELSPE